MICDAALQRGKEKIEQMKGKELGSVQGDNFVDMGIEKKKTKE